MAVTALLSRAREQAASGLSPRSSPHRPILRVPVRLVVAPTSVTDHSGNFINGLTASDFPLYDNDVPQQIHEDGDFLPISLAIAIQTNLKKQAVERVRELGPLLGALVVGVGGEAAIFSFDNKLEVRQDFTPDLGRLTHALRRIEFSPGPSSRDRCHARCHAAARSAARSAPPHSAADLRSLRDQGSQSTLDDALADVAMSNTLIYWLNIARGAAAEDPVPALTRYTGGQQYALQNRACARTRHHSDRRRDPRPVSAELHAGQYQRNRIPSHPRGLANAPASKFARVPAIGQPYES